MVDRAARDETIRLIEDFLNDRIGSVDFDCNLSEIQSDDELVAGVIQDCWFYYSDDSDHLVSLDKISWDQLQRFLLLLRSDVAAKFKSRLVWQFRNTLALALLILSIWLGWHFRLSWGILALLAIASWAYLGFLFWPGPKLESRGDPTEPFESAAQMRKIHESCRNFRKQRFRKELGERVLQRNSLLRNRAPVNRILIGMIYAALAPFILFTSCFPNRKPLGYTLFGGQLETPSP